MTGIKNSPGAWSYEAALVSGGILLLENRKFFAAITEFDLGHESYLETARFTQSFITVERFGRCAGNGVALGLWGEDPYDFPEDFAFQNSK